MTLKLVALCVVLWGACASTSTIASHERAMHASRWDEALAELTAHERAATERGDSRARVAALVATSRVLLDDGLNRRADVSLALVPAERARSLAQGLGDDGLIADALDRVGMVRFWQWALADEGSSDAPLVEAAALFERARVLRTGGTGLAYAHFHLGLIADARDQAEVARAQFARALARAGRDGKIASYALRHLAQHDEAAGRRDIAEARLRRSLELRRGLGWKAGVASGLDALGAMLHRAGRTSEARPILREAIATARVARSAYYTSRASCALARLEAAAGDVGAAIAVLRAAEPDVARLAARSLRADHTTLLDSLVRRCPGCAAPPR